jgi:hypothetical protein
VNAALFPKTEEDNHMKPVVLTFTDAQGNKTKTYSTCSIKTGIMDRIFDIAEKAEEYESGKLGVAESRGFFRDLKAIMVDAFGRQFTYDELDEGLDFDEMIRVFTEMCSAAVGNLGKNR